MSQKVRTRTEEKNAIEKQEKKRKQSDDEYLRQKDLWDEHCKKQVEKQIEDFTPKQMSMIMRGAGIEDKTELFAILMEDYDDPTPEQLAKLSEYIAKSHKIVNEKKKIKTKTYNNKSGGYGGGR